MTNREQIDEPTTPDDGLDPLEVVMRAAFGPRPAEDDDSGKRIRSVIAALMGGCEVRLQGEPSSDTTSTPPRTVAEETPEEAPSPGRFQVRGELAEGGLGVVLRGHDLGLGRDVAIKRLRERHLHDPDMVRRFVVEAQIAGQLQHPGVVPIYDVGLRADDTPCIIMKLVRGETLAALLSQRASVDDRLVHFVRIFERVGQTLAYAHSRGVIHRDLKPSNVMVGAFGEVQLMDWGFAKVLGAPDAERGAGGGKPASTEESSVHIREEDPESHSEAGSVMGTFAYMAPEQARGEVEQVDERSDVFGLGAILCEVLTGSPPYVGETLEKLVEQARGARLESCYERLGATRTDRTLVEICRRCLAPDPQDRFPDGGAVASEVEAYLAAVDERARKAELESAEARVRAEEADARARAERRARRLTLALATTVILALVGAGGGYSWIERQRTRERQRVIELVDEALAEVNLQRGEARGAGEPERALAAYDQALFVAHRTEELIGESAKHGDLLERMRLCIAELEGDRAAARAELDQHVKDELMRRRLESIRGLTADEWDWLATDEAYAAAFREYGIDVEALEDEEAAARIRQSAISDELAGGLDDWLGARAQCGEDCEQLLHVADAADAGSWRGELRRALVLKDGEVLHELARRFSVSELSATEAHRLGKALSIVDLQGAAALLKEALHRHPDDFWLSFELGWICTMTKPRRSEEAVARLRAAVALRPESHAAWDNLGRALMYDGQLEESRGAFLRALELAPGEPITSCCYAELLRVHLGDFEEAQRVLETALEGDPQFATAHAALGDIRYAYGKIAEAEACWQRAADLDARRVDALGNLGVLRMMGGDFEAARGILEEAVRREPTNALNHYNLGVTLRQLGDFDAAIAEYREAIGHDPTLSVAHINLAIRLEEREQNEEAEAHYGRALQLPSESTPTRDTTGTPPGQGDRPVIRMSTTHAIALSRLGRFLRERPNLPEAAQMLSRAVELDGEDPWIHNERGLVRMARGNADGARECFAQAVELNEYYREARLNLAEALLVLGEHEEAATHCEWLIELDEDDRQAWVALGRAQWNQGELDGALDCLEAAIAVEEDAWTRAMAGAVLLEAGDAELAVGALERAVELGPGAGLAHLHLARARLRLGEVEGASTSARSALEQLSPEREHEALLVLAQAEDRAGRLEDAEGHLRQALEDAPDPGEARRLLGEVLLELGRRAEAVAELEELVRTHPDHAEAFAHLALGLRDVGRFYEAAAALRRGAELGLEGSADAIDAGRLAEDLEVALELDARLPALLEDASAIEDPVQLAALARLFTARGFLLAAARAWESALARGADSDDDGFFDAARAAARAAVESTEAAERERWRRRALEWLRRDLAILKGRENDRQSVVRALRIRSLHADLAEVRGPEALAAMPEAEGVAWRAYWQDLADRIAATD